MIIDWANTEVIGISGIRIEMPNEEKISIFTDNNLTLHSSITSVTPEI